MKSYFCDNPDEEILSELVKTYFSEATVQAIAGAVIVTLVVFATYRYVPVWLWALALAIVYIVTLLRIQLARQYSKAPGSRSASDWGGWQTRYAFFAGAAWGGSFVQMLPYLSAELQIFILSVSAVSAVASVSEGFSYACPSRVFSVPLIVPQIIWLAFSSSPLHPIMAILLAVFLPLLLWRGNIQNQAFIRSIELRFVNERLVHELADQCERAEAASKSKSRFLAAASHDLRQPVAATVLYVEAIKFTHLLPQQKILIDKLAQSIEIYSNQLELLLNISRFDSGLIKPELRIYKLEELFSWLEVTFAQNAAEKGLKFKLFMPKGNALALKTDLTLLKTVLMNLISNAMKFTTHGGILVSARLRENSILLQVWDSGSGINPENIAHIFDEFYQVTNPQRERNNGLGLGLAIAQRSIKLLGGEIECCSTIGKGSVFRFSLPVSIAYDEAVMPDIVEPPQTSAPEISFARGKSFVLIEDDQMVAQAMAELLEEVGGEVRHFTSAEEAFNHPDIEAADYYIVDNMLSGEKTGIQFLKTIQQRVGREIAAVLVSGDTSTEFMQQTSTLAWPVLHKPVRISKLAKVFNEQTAKQI